MSLKLTNSATKDQLQWLKNHEYYGKVNLTKDEASQIMTEIMEQERLHKDKQEWLTIFKKING